jgi:dTDP-glucose 4,6-dehydratase
VKILVTGGAGFIGSNYVKRMLANRDFDISGLIALDNLTYAGSLDNLREVLSDSRFKFIKGDICDKELVSKLISEVDTVVHFAAESHVDRSISSSLEFVETNVAGTTVLLDALRNNQRVRFLHVSTDEVYGSIASGSWDESAPLSPNSPYSASKASSDLMALSYFRTYGLDIMISRCCNNYGPNQFPEKLIPFFVTNLLQGKKLPLYGSGMNVREWIHVNDHCDALNWILKSGKSGEVYNVGSGVEITNLALTRKILELFGKDDDSIEYVRDRLGHDLRYSMDCGKLRAELGFVPITSFEEGLAETINWYKNNRPWWEEKII